MNNERRKQLNEALALLDQAQALADQAMEIVDGVRDDEQEAFDNLSESFQNGERGEAMQAALGALESVNLEDIFGEARDYIEEAQAA